jgi:hypothetical protein
MYGPEDVLLKHIALTTQRDQSILVQPLALDFGHFPRNERAGKGPLHKALIFGGIEC